MTQVQTSSSAPKANKKRPPVRQRIIDATLQGIHNQGINTLTPTHIAKLAGIRQPNFYAHFKNMDACLSAAAEFIFSQFDDFNQAAFAELRSEVSKGGDFVELNRRYHIELAQVLADHRNVSELYFRHRNGSSAFARALHRLDRQTVSNVREHLWEWAALAGVSARHIDEISLLAELQVGNVATAMLALFDGIIPDATTAGEALATNAAATTIATLRRLLEEDQAPVPPILQDAE